MTTATLWKEGFKSADSYLTAEGWPLGTECHYVLVEAEGIRVFHCAPTIEEARNQAREWLKNPAVPDYAKLSSLAQEQRERET